MRFWKLGLTIVAAAALLAACGTVQNTVSTDGLEDVVESAEGTYEASWNGENGIKPGAPAWPDRTDDDPSWNGRNGLDSERCDLVGEGGRTADGWIHWVFATKGDSTDAQLVLGGTGSGTYAPGEPLNANVWHVYTPFFELGGLEATLELTGTPGRPGRLVISDWCEGDDGGDTLRVEKTAEARYKLVHDWEVEKTLVDPGKGVLVVPVDGQATATWAVDVTYLGSTAGYFAVSGDITIENNISSQELPVTITEITDDLGLAGYDDVAVDCGTALPYELAFGDTLTCTYDVAIAAEDVEAGDSGTNTVTVQAETRAEPYVATADWAFDEPYMELKREIDVKDYLTPADTLTHLGTLDAHELDVDKVSFPFSATFHWDDLMEPEPATTSTSAADLSVQTGEDECRYLEVGNIAKLYAKDASGHFLESESSVLHVVGGTCGEAE